MFKNFFSNFFSNFFKPATPILKRCSIRDGVMRVQPMGYNIILRHGITADMAKASFIQDEFIYCIDTKTYYRNGIVFKETD